MYLYLCICIHIFVCIFISASIYICPAVVKNLRPVQKKQEMQVRSLGRRDALEEGMATHSSILAWRIPMDRGS